MLGRKALAIINMLIYVVLFTIISGTMLSIVSSQTRLMEGRIRQIKGHFAAESALVEYMDRVRRGVVNPDVTQNLTFSIPWNIDASGGVVNRSVNITYIRLIGLNQTGCLTATFNATY